MVEHESTVELEWKPEGRSDITCWGRIKPKYPSILAVWTSREEEAVVWAKQQVQQLVGNVDFIFSSLLE